MKMTSGLRLNERRKRALERLEGKTPEEIARKLSYMKDENGNPDTKRIEAWTARRDREIATLKKRTGRF